MRAHGLLIVALGSLTTLTGCYRYAVAPPLPGEEKEAVAPPPPGMVAVNVVSAEKRVPWDVYVDDKKVCTTPCNPVLRVESGLYLESQYGDVLDVPDLGLDIAQARQGLLVAEPHSRPKKVNGIVFTTLGGMGLVTAITLTAVGCSDLDRRAGVCTAGLITGAVSAPLTAIFLWMLVDSSPKAHLLPLYAGQGESK